PVPCLPAAGSPAGGRATAEPAAAANAAATPTRRPASPAAAAVTAPPARSIHARRRQTLDRSLRLVGKRAADHRRRPRIRNQRARPDGPYSRFHALAPHLSRTTEDYGRGGFDDSGDQAKRGPHLLLPHHGFGEYREPSHRSDSVGWELQQGHVSLHQLPPAECEGLVRVPHLAVSDRQP